MAKIISLGCKVADVHQRFSTVHSALFGASSYRLVIHALIGRSRIQYGAYVKTLTELLEELSELETQIGAESQKNSIVRGSDLLPQVLAQYTHKLTDVINQLIDICHQLKTDETDYRKINADGHSYFNDAKIEYDHALSRLEHLGGKLNKLFSSY
jgi:Mg2+ and Co2+ transporter CorA